MFHFFTTNSKSGLFGHKRKIKILNKLNNSIELLTLIKECAANKNNWKNSKTLVVRIGVGVKRHDDELLSCDDLVPTGILGLEELRCSQDPKDDPREKFNSSRVSVSQKDKPRLVNIFMEKLYNDPASPLYHGFVDEMHHYMSQTLRFDRGDLYESLIGCNNFPPNSTEIEHLTRHTISKSKIKLDSLIPTREMFPPVGNDTKPPKLSLWKHTKAGREYAITLRNSNINESVNGDSTITSVSGSNNIDTASHISNVSVGMVEVFKFE